MLAAVEESAKRSAAILIGARGARAFGDGFTALLLPAYLTAVGLSTVQIGLIVSATLFGSAILTLAVGLLAHRARTKTLLTAACALMFATGIAFSEVRGFWPLAIVGFVGTLNPSGGDVSLFLPLEQSLLAHAAVPERRTGLFARYGLVGALMAAVGALSLRGLQPLAREAGLAPLSLMQWLFVLYGLLALVALALYATLPKPHAEDEATPAPLGPSRNAVIRLAMLFSVDSFGGGFLVQSMIALWLFRRFGLSLAAAGDFFFWAGLLTAGSMLAAGPLARRFGLVRTMVFTHLPANICVVAAAFAPQLWMVIALLLTRAALSTLDVPARTAYVMSVVTPGERAAAAGVTNVPRSLAAAISPSVAGWMLSISPFAWPLLVGGALKIAYDLALLRLFGSTQLPEDAPR